MSIDLSRAYELLGVKPGVSIRELKAAHRDLAKVWHPDRFLHDLRLQEKALEKLKEINEAYELLISGKTPRPAPERAAETAHSAIAKPRRQGGNGKWAAVPLLAFVAVFAITTRVLLNRNQRLPQPQSQTEAQTVQDASTRSETNPRSESARKANREDAATEVIPTSSDATPSQPTAALDTVTVAIDPESGLLARPDCPLRSRMTYPRGNEPSRYCSIVHAAPPKESRIKSIAEKILPQKRKGAKEEPDPKN